MLFRSNCIDNVIHTAAGVQLRLACADLMDKQGHDEPTGEVKVTEGYNLPSKYVFHTVGPIVYNRVTEEQERLLASCYRQCLYKAKEMGLASIAFCCISTGEYRFPNELAAEIAIEEVSAFMKENGDGLEVVFNVFKDLDRDIYQQLLGSN